MKYTKLLAATMILSVISLNSVYAGTNFSYTQEQPQMPVMNNYNSQQTMAYSSNQPLRGSVLTVPAGSTFNATLMSPLSSATASIGQNVTMMLGHDFYYGDIDVDEQII